MAEFGGRMQESNAGSVPANESQQHLQQGRRILLLTEGEGGEDGSGGWGVGIQLPWVCQNTNIKQLWRKVPIKSAPSEV